MLARQPFCFRKGISIAMFVLRLQIKSLSNPVISSDGNAIPSWFSKSRQMSERRRRQLESKKKNYASKHVFVPLSIEHEIFAQMHALLTLKFFIAIATIKLSDARLFSRSGEM